MPALKFLFATIAVLSSACSAESPAKEMTHTTTHFSKDGKTENANNVGIGTDSMEFECIKSASGNCYVLVFSDGCTTSIPDENTEVRVCTTKKHHKFVLKTGEKRSVSTPSKNAKHCITHDAMPIAPACAK